MTATQGNLFEQPKTLDYTRVLHTRENNPESQSNLEKNKFHFTGQCAVVYSLLLKGIRLTTWLAISEYRIGHLARRIGDLRKAGIDVKTEKIDKRGTVEYFIELT